MAGLGQMKSAPTKEQSIETLKRNLTPDALAVLARLSSKAGVSEKIVKKEAMIKMYI